MRIELLSLTGETSKALAAAERLAKERRLTTSQRCRLCDVVGLNSFRRGHNGKAIETYQAGIHLAESDLAMKEEGILRVRFFRNQIHWTGPQQAAAEVGELRRRTHRVADPSLSLELQLGLVELASKLGLYSRARGHLGTAKALLPAVENQALHAECTLVEVALTALESNRDYALRLALELSPIADDIGSESVKCALAINLAHLLLEQSRFEEARQWLDRGFGGRLGGGIEVPLRDTRMLLFLGEGDIDQASGEAQTIADLLDELKAHDTFFGLWHLVTNIKWLYRIGDAAGGVTLATDALPRIERMADRNLLERMQLLLADGLGRTGRAVEGAALMAHAVNANPDPPLEMIAEAARVAGRLAANDHPGAAAAHFDRAARILHSVGNLTARSEVLRDAAESLAAARQDAALTTAGPVPVVRDAPPDDPPDDRPPAAALTERLAALVELGAHPPLVAAETLSLIADTAAVLHVTLTETHPDGRRELVTAWSAPGSPVAVDDHPHAVRLDAGTHRDRHYTLTAIPRPTASARATLLAAERLLHAALAIARARQDQREQAALWPDRTPEQQLGLVCASERMLDLVKTVRRVAGSNLTVLISGETGTGKELFARALHLASPRRDRVFLPFNCSTVPRDMLDSQLFGYRRGAFTGAHDDGPGVIRAAAGGTLFLDEIGEMSPEAQPKLLRFLESGEILPLGEPRPQRVDVRIVAATNANLDQLVSEGRFREDLYYRLNVIPIHIPPLRERREEVPALVDHFLEHYGRELQKPLMRVADETLEYLLLYRWPGNVRQLANEIRRLVAFGEPGAVLLPTHLSPPSSPAAAPSRWRPPRSSCGWTSRSRPPPSRSSAR
jgi:transcriptional regulator with AAA-type ATPase domain